MTSAPVDQLADAMDLTGGLVAGVRPDQWGLDTPCSGWSVRDLVNHLVVGHRRFACFVRGEPAPSLDVDHLGEDAVAAYRTTADELLEAFRQEGALDRIVTVPIGPVPGIVALHLRLVEALVHGWDLASATGQPTSFPDDMVEQALAFTADSLTAIPPGRTPFGSPQPAPDEAPTIDRLAALLGRPVDVEAGAGRSVVLPPPA
ncbi:MAG TPA: TIGR03086 family metal-binding protein [Acidimicrobiales bacterium]|jgi:uncharacterized protein (TIGR03086 family)|nr:TIGR03086 family metal-binding protein [Acidimicrobiales bacterium]